MTNHPAVSAAIVITAVTVIVLGYSAGRAHAAWLDVRGARREVPKARRAAWGRTRGLAGGVLLFLVVIAAAVTDLLH
jgi:hypothetical protein